MTKIINLFGGPGCHKSTTAYGLAYFFKLSGMNAELVTEVAKDMTWAKRVECLKSQPLIFGKQLNRIERLIGKVDYIITDSPVLLSAVYAGKKYPSAFIEGIVETFKTFDNINYLINRLGPYRKEGRGGNERTAIAIDKKVKNFLLDKAISYRIINGNEAAVGVICDDLFGRFNHNARITPKSYPATEDGGTGKVRWAVQRNGVRKTRVNREAY